MLDSVDTIVSPKQVLALIQAGNVTAEAQSRRLLVADPGSGDAVQLQGLVALQQERIDAATVWFARAARVWPQVSGVYANLAVARRKAGDMEGSRRALRRAVVLDPARAEIAYNLANLLKALRCHSEAMRWYRVAVTLNPRQPKFHYNLGNLFHDLGHFNHAVAHLERAWALSDQSMVDAAINLGMTRQSQNQVGEALGWYDRALALAPDNPSAHFNRGLALLVLGRLEEGWGEYAWRWRLPEMRGQDGQGPSWTGEPMPTGTILLRSEQGHGDAVQFIRYLPKVAKRCGKVIVRCQPALRSLLVANFPNVTVVADGDPLPPYDRQASLLDLPGLFGTTIEQIPACVPYLRVANLECVPPTASDKVSVGFIWAGNADHKNDHRRSLDICSFQSLFAIPGIRPFSLQVGPRSVDLNLLGKGHGVLDLTPGIETFADTAERLMSLDLLVTVDTSTAHLAGALGRPVWILLPFSPDWRWLLERARSPWYPSALLFRQHQYGYWSGPPDKLSERLRTVVADRSLLLPHISDI